MPNDVTSDVSQKDHSKNQAVTFADGNGPVECVTVTINGAVYKVPAWFSEVSLADFLRNHLRLTGTKVSCGEGGCGACNVFALIPDPLQPGNVTRRVVNSCLAPILSCHGWEITTVEGIGSQEKPHRTQKAITEHSATQCGFCSPGLVMSMYSLLEASPDRRVTEHEVENYLGGNLCRCTGYRSVLSAFRSLASSEGTPDLEDLGTKICKSTGKACSGACATKKIFPEPVSALPEACREKAPVWFRPKSLQEVFAILERYERNNVYLVVGRTGAGVYWDGPYDAFVDLKAVTGLYHVEKKSDGLHLGANLSLTDVIAACHKTAGLSTRYTYLKEIAKLLEMSGHPAVRNVGSWAGNLAMKHRHPQMPSDLFTALAAAGALISVGDKSGEAEYSMEEFLGLDMKQRLIIRLKLLPLGADVAFRAYKIMPRAQNSHGYLIAAFQAKTERSPSGSIVIKDKPSIAFGAVSARFVRADKTEQYLTGKDLTGPSVLRGALELLNTEIMPDTKPPEASADYKRGLAVSLFYKFVLELVGDKLNRRYRSAIGALERPLSTGVVTFPTDESQWPVSKPIPKIEAMAQCTGDIKYPSDVIQDGMLYAAFAITDRGNARIRKIHTHIAEAMDGVVRILVAADLPGMNNISTESALWDQDPQIFLATDEALYADQPVAIVVAVSQQIAESAAKLVTVEYSEYSPVAGTPEEAIALNSFYNNVVVKDIIRGDVDAAIAAAPRKVSGKVNIGNQTHFHLETQISVAFPTEDGVFIEAGTQYMDSVQAAVAHVLNLTANRVQIHVLRNGGGFGAKTFGNHWPSCASAVAAHLLKRPVKMHMSFHDTLKIIGKRLPYHLRYEAGFDERGKLLGIKMDIYSGIGGLQNHGFTRYMNNWLDNVYSCPAWKITLTPCKTHVPFNQSFRGPGITESIYFIETVVEHAAKSLGRPAVDIRMVNLMKDGDMLLNNTAISNPVMETVLAQLLQESEYYQRAKTIQSCNQENKWRKRGIAVVPIRMPMNWGLMWFTCILNVYHEDGTITVAHGGIEMGQGIHTKVAQVVAHALGVDMSIIKILTQSTTMHPNNAYSAGSTTSETCCYAAMEACKQLNERLAPYREKNPSATWKEITKMAYNDGVDLQAKAWPAHEPAGYRYQVWGAMATEVEVDCLTGEYIISRVDILEDVGNTVSPIVDIGQIEGGAVIGLGYWTMEDVIYEKGTGKNLTYNTWTYKVPTAKDIPVDFRVSIMKNVPNPLGVHGSKAVGEPPVTMACSVVFALKNAITAFRAESGRGDEWFDVDTPLTPERVRGYCQIGVNQLTLP